MNRVTGITAFAQTGNPFMDGLPLGVPQVNASRDLLNSDFAGEPYLYGYNPLSLNDGLAGDKPKTVLVRPRAGAPPGWPGFFGWVASVSPDMYDYLRVSLPNFVEDRQSFRSGGASIDGLGRLGDIDLSFPPVEVAMPTLPQTEGQTDGVPLPTTTATSQIIDTVKAAAAAFLPLITQQKLLSINLDRARNGQPPIDMAAYESATQGLNVGVNRSTQNTVLMLAAGIGGVFLLSKLLSRR